MTTEEDVVRVFDPDGDVETSEPSSTARCSQCGEVKRLDDFNRETRRRNGRRVKCRECQRRYNEAFRSRKPLYNTWNLMMQRCYNERNPAFPRYGGRGITVCERWHDYESFVEDVSPKPSSRHSIDRIDNDGPYSPDNCRWALPCEQASNQSTNHLVEVDGVTRTLAEWARVNGIPRFTVEARVYRYGWDDVEAVTKPARTYDRGNA